jgi:predicted dehydrogenase
MFLFASYLMCAPSAIALSLVVLLPMSYAWTHALSQRAIDIAYGETCLAGVRLMREERGTSMRQIGIGLYGMNGHQVHRQLAGHPHAACVAVAGVPPDALPAGVHPRRCESLVELLALPEVELVSLCSPRRADQARDAVQCLRAGKHVYAEKPCALREADLDAIVEAVRTTGCRFHEMAGTVVQQPYRAMRQAVAGGAIGTVVQVNLQKSYPWHDGRPADEAIDGGLAMQVGIYALRFVEHIAGVKVRDLRLVETRLGNPQPASACRMACSMVMELANGGLASAICNYLNPFAGRLWGYEILRIFGTRGLVESNADGSLARLIPVDGTPVDLDVREPTLDYFDVYVDALLGLGAMPLTLEEELSPTRWVIRGKAAAGNSLEQGI